MQHNNCVVCTVGGWGVSLSRLTIREETEVPVVDHSVVGFVETIQRSLSLSNVRGFADVNTYRSEDSSRKLFCIHEKVL